MKRPVLDYGWTVRPSRFGIIFTWICFVCAVGQFACILVRADVRLWLLFCTFGSMTGGMAFADTGRSGRSPLMPIIAFALNALATLIVYLRH